MEGTLIIAIISIVIAGLSLGVAGIDIIYTWLRTRIIGPDFRFVDVYVERFWVAKHTEKGNRAFCRIRTIPMNTGNSKGYLKLNQIQLNIEIKGKRYVENHKPWVYHPAYQIRTKFADKVFVFDFDEKIVDYGWEKGKLILDGYYYNHKGHKFPYRIEFIGPSKENIQWKLKTAPWLKS